MAQAIILLAILVAAAPLVLHKQPQLVGQDHAYVVLSGSMVPYMDPGDIIFVSELDPATVQVGDVITFRAEAGSTTLFTHRVIEVIQANGDVAWRTKGDANEDPDSTAVTADLLVGRQEWILPKWGHLSQFSSSRTGFFVFVAVPAFLLILVQLTRLYKELDAADKRRQERKALKALKAHKASEAGSLVSGAKAKSARGPTGAAGGRSLSGPARPRPPRG